LLIVTTACDGAYTVLPSYCTVIWFPPVSKYPSRFNVSVTLSPLPLVGSVR
jgi:hypothetical protein